MNNVREPIRILQIVGRMDRGGIETMIMNLYRNIDRDKIQFDFLAHYGREADYNDEIRTLGGRIYEMPALKNEKHVYYWRVFEYVTALRKFFHEHKYKIIHGHMTNTASIYMPIARDCGVTCRIVHSHNTCAKAGLLGYVTDFLQKLIYIDATDLFACSNAAAKWFYTSKSIEAGKVTVLHNAVDAKKFRYNKDIRNLMRKELGLENKIVIGCVARFRAEKNHIFLLDVLKEITKCRNNVVLVFVGDGPCEKEVKKKATELQLINDVIFLGMRADIADIMQAMDVFTLASLWEGLPVVGIEAQASGLRCIVSDSITDEMNVIDMVEYISLDAPLNEWAERLIIAAEQPRVDTFYRIKESGYDIHTVAPWLQEFYMRKAE